MLPFCCGKRWSIWGPIRLKDVEETQQKIVSLIRKLEDSGEIVVARSGEDEMVV